MSAKKKKQPTKIPARDRGTVAAAFPGSRSASGIVVDEATIAELDAAVRSSGGLTYDQVIRGAFSLALRRSTVDELNEARASAQARSLDTLNFPTHPDRVSDVGTGGAIGAMLAPTSPALEMQRAADAAAEG